MCASLNANTTSIAEQVQSIALTKQSDKANGVRQAQLSRMQQEHDLQSKKTLKQAKLSLVILLLHSSKLGLLQSVSLFCQSWRRPGDVCHLHQASA